MWTKPVLAFVKVTSVPQVALLRDHYLSEIRTPNHNNNGDNPSEEPSLGCGFEFESGKRWLHTPCSCSSLRPSLNKEEYFSAILDHISMARELWMKEVYKGDC